MSNAKSIADAVNSNLNQPIDSDWLDEVGLKGNLHLQDHIRLEIWSNSVALAFDNTKPGEYYTNRGELSLPHIKTRRQLLSLIALLKPERITEMNVIAGETSDSGEARVH